MESSKFLSYFAPNDIEKLEFHEDTMAGIGTKLFTRFKGELVGSDEFGNKYYREKNKKRTIQIGRNNTERRWVVYKHIAEPSLIPPYWHAWMHHITDEVPTEDDMKRAHDWQKAHKPNLTGTKHAYMPPSVTTGQREKASSDYEAWKPE